MSFENLLFILFILRIKVSSCYVYMINIFVLSFFQNYRNITGIKFKLKTLHLLKFFFLFKV